MHTGTTSQEAGAAGSTNPTARMLGLAEHLESGDVIVVRGGADGVA